MNRVLPCFILSLMTLTQCSKYESGKGDTTIPHQEKTGDYNMNRHDKDACLELHYNSRKEYFIGMKDSKPVYNTFAGTRISLHTTITYVQQDGNSPSIANESSLAKFKLDSKLILKASHREIDHICLHYDQFALFEPKAFKNGDSWKIDLTENGELISLSPM